MAQQINLCTPILLTQRRYFSALTMVQALAVLVVLGGALCGYWVWSLNQASDGLKRVLQTNVQELASLRAAIKEGRAAAGPAEQALAQALHNQQAQVRQRGVLLAALQQGLARPGGSHAARMLWLAQSIPPAVWLTQVQVDEGHLEASGFTLEPAALNDWTAKLGASAPTQDQRLTTLKVESASLAPPGASARAASAPGLPVWSFSLRSATPQTIAAGSKP